MGGWKRWIGVLLLCGAALLYLRLRSSGAAVSPYETVNDLYGWEDMTFTAGKAVYPADVKTVELTFRNDAPDGVVLLGGPGGDRWVLEREASGVWYSLSAVDHREPVWRFREEDGTPDSLPSGIVNWGGGVLTWYCDVGAFYASPLEPGRYRIVLPDCEHLQDTADLAVEFEVA